MSDQIKLLQSIVENEGLSQEQRDKAQEKLDALVAKALGEDENQIPEKFLEWTYTTLDDRYFRFDTGEYIRPNAFNALMNVHIPTYDSGKETKRVHSNAHIYFSEEVRRQVSELEYAPGEEPIFVDSLGKRKANLYTEKVYPELEDHIEGDGALAVAQVKAHLEQYYPEFAHVITQWWAHNVQKPGKKMKWGICFIGIQGSGKSLSEHVLTAAMSHAHVKKTSNAEINSTFSDWSVGACVRIIDELAVEGAKRKQVMSMLKDVITADTLSVNRKGLSIQNGVRNTQNYIITTNDEEALPVEKSERRWLIVDDKIKSLADELKKLGGDYFFKLYSLIEKHPGAIRSWLLSVDISDLNTIYPPASEARDEMYENTQSKDYHIVKEILFESFEPDVVSTKNIKDRYKAETGQSINPKTLVKILRELGYESWTNPDRSDGAVADKNNHNHRIYKKPDVDLSLKSLTDLRSLIDTTSVVV